MAERTTEGLAAELEWAASGAALELDSLRAQVTDLQGSCDERSIVIAELRASVERLRSTAEERAELIATLDAALVRERDEHARALDRLHADLTAMQVRVEGVADERDAERERVAALRREYAADLRTARQEADLLRGQLEQRQSELGAQAVADELQRVCDERLALIERLSAEVDALRVVAHERAALLEAADARVAALRREHEADLRAARQEAELLRGRLEQRESQAGAEAIADELQRICDERLALIERLSADLEALRAVAHERAQLLEINDAAFREREATLVAEAERRTVLLADLTAAFEAKVREVEELRGSVPRAS
jgi:hypothetical protein